MMLIFNKLRKEIQVIVIREMMICVQRTADSGASIAERIMPY